jgi:hypothetical protein
MRPHFSNGLKLRNALLIGLVLGGGTIHTVRPAQAEVSLEEPVAVQTQTLEPIALEAAALEVEVPEELADLREMGRQMGDRLSEIDPEVIKQVMRPLGRQALRIFLDRAPGLSQKAIDLGEQGLAELEKRAMEGLEQAQADFELGGEAEPGL